MRRRAGDFTMTVTGFRTALTNRGKQMSTFRRIDSLLDGKTSEQLASEVAVRERQRAEQDERRHSKASAPPREAESPREQDANAG
jgi:hypothetical protein